MSLDDQLKELFCKWRIVNDIQGPFIEEYLTNENDWTKASLKLMVMMKEAVSEEEFQYQHFIQNGGYLEPREGRTWRPLVRWVYGAFNNFPPYTTIEQQEDYIRERSRTFFKQVYFTNVKKVAGGARADERVLWKAGKQGSSLLVEQIDIVKPHVVLSVAVLLCMTYFTLHSVRIKNLSSKDGLMGECGT